MKKSETEAARDGDCGAATHEAPPWRWDEFKQVGKDYAADAEVRVYDESHADFRDLDAESERVLDGLGIGREHTLIDFGCGTGTFAMHAARRCEKVHAVDVSSAMLDRASAKATEAGVDNIMFHHAGFLSYEHAGPAVNAVTTTFAFHHLPDLWKGIALKRMHGMLELGGQLYLHDVILEEAGALENVAALIEQLAAAGGDFLRKDAEEHFREEHSTYDWVMDELLRRAGFTIEHKEIEDGVMGTYHCLAT